MQKEKRKKTKGKARF